MALMLSKLNDALLASGAPADKAQAAAEEVAAYDSRLSAIDTRLTLLSWMVGGLYALGVPALWLLIRVAAKVGAVG